MPAASSSHSSSGPVTPPGNRHPIPTIATGSPAPPPPAARTRAPAAVPVSSGPHEPGQRHRSRVIEDQRGGQPQPGGLVQPVAQLHRGQRVKPQVTERPTRLHRVSGSVSDDHRSRRAHHTEQGCLPVRFWQPGQPFPPPRDRGTVSRQAFRLPRRPPVPSRGHIPVGPSRPRLRHHQCLVPAAYRRQQRRALFCRELIAGTPRHRYGRPSRRPAITGQPVVEASCRRPARHQHERIQVRVQRQLVNGPCPVNRAPHGRNPVTAVMPRPRRMHHFGHRHPGQKARQRGPVSDIAGHHLHRGTRFGQPGRKSGRTCRARPRPTRQHQVPGAVSAGQVSRNLSPECLRSFGHEHGCHRARSRRVWRDGQHELADMPGLAHEPERFAGPPHVPGRHRQHRQLSGRQQAHDLPQDLSQPGRAGLGRSRTAGTSRPGTGGRSRRPHEDRSCPSRGTSRRTAAAAAMRRSAPRTANSARYPSQRRRSPPGTRPRTPPTARTRCDPDSGPGRSARRACPGWPCRTPPVPGTARLLPRPFPPRPQPSARVASARPENRPGRPARTRPWRTRAAPTPRPGTTIPPGWAPVAAHQPPPPARTPPRPAPAPDPRRPGRAHPARSENHSSEFDSHHRIAAVHAQADQHVAEVQSRRADRHPNVPGLQRSICSRAGHQGQPVERSSPGRIQPPRSSAARRRKPARRARQPPPVRRPVPDGEFRLCRRQHRRRECGPVRVRRPRR